MYSVRNDDRAKEYGRHTVQGRRGILLHLTIGGAEAPGRSCEAREEAVPERRAEEATTKSSDRGARRSARGGKQRGTRYKQELEKGDPSKERRQKRTEGGVGAREATNGQDPQT